ncbi:Sugar (pentulose or hexulose) kinase [Lentzea albidocapillata subsp. violacea]|uniref:Sugar (Pentulose or hexulose) kinase n=1 Tax=Lentzea albidocapillata subsp. violacea TaxID=128104 RepID=A0A1G8PJZ9_9PSEU|nr:FGGY-family carbohydrate kinase [Lentzea albidocapillata]SDI92628.1 Sugar (pentulose or hexulose) kinase [Lentzea albidocapillata subsp. violacea]
MTYLIAIDNGSQSTKVSIVDEVGRVHASAQRPLRPYEHPKPGQVVHPDDDVWDSIAEACTEAMQRFTGAPGEIAGVGLCTIRFCRAVMDADGRLTEPLLSWMDDRLAQPAGTRNLVSASSGYVTLRLTGERRDTAGNYEGMWPIDHETWRWPSSSPSYADTGMRREQLFDLVDPGALLGNVTGEAARATGLPAGLPVFATSNDKAVEALGSGLSDELLVSLGTYIAAMTTGDRHTVDPEGRFWSNFGSVPGKYLYESNGIRRGMWTVSWYRQLVGSDLGDLEAGAAGIEPGCGGLMTVLDWLAPGDHPYRRGALLGFDGTQGRYHVYRSILEGIALTMSRHSALMGEALGREFPELIVSGGGSRSDLMMQIFADVFGRPVRRTRMSDAAGLGAAICAAVGSGVHPDWDSAVKAMVTTADVFTPSAAAPVYAKLAQDHARITDHTDPLFASLNHITAG